MGKKSIRFFNDREVRADVVRVINDEPDYTKTGDYYQHY